MEQTTQNLKQQVELYGEPLGEVVRRVTQALGLTQGGLAQVIGLSAPMLSQLVSAQRVKIGNPAVVSRLRAVSELADLAVAGGIEPADIAGELDGIRAATGAYTSPTTGHLRRPAAQGGMPPRTGAPAAGVPTGPEAGQGTGVGRGTGVGPGAGVGQGSGTGQGPGVGQGAGVGHGAGVGQGVGRPTVFASPGGLPVETAAAAWTTALPDVAARAVVRALQDLFREVASASEIQRAAAAAAAESPAVAELLLAYGTGRTADALAHYEQHHG